MNVLVTGANGFIGRVLCKKLPAEGWMIRGAVRSMRQMDTLPASVDPLLVGSIGTGNDWASKLYGIDCVVHLAAHVHIIKKTTHNSLSLFRKVNVVGTEHLAHEAALANVKRFIYMSSVKVNGERTGDRGHGPGVRSQEKIEVRGQEGELKEFFSEEDVPEPQDPYAVSKWEAEKVLNKISEETGMEIVILRSPLVYGPRVKANFLRILKVVERGIPLPLASVNNRRSFIYIGNLVDAIITCMKHPKAAGQTYFVSDNEDVSTLELIRRMGYALGRPVRLFYCPTDVLKVAGKLTGKLTEIERLTGSLTVDISKITHELGWAPPFSMEQGLKETAMWYLKRRNISRKGAKTLR